MALFPISRGPAQRSAHDDSLCLLAPSVDPSFSLGVSQLCSHLQISKSLHTFKDKVNFSFSITYSVENASDYWTNIFLRLISKLLYVKSP